MAAEYSANAAQNVAANQSVIFTESPIPCNRGMIFHRDESGIFSLSSMAHCGCNQAVFETLYHVGFHANIAVPTGGTAEEIELAIVIDGEIDPSSMMIVTPAEVGEFFNVGAGIIIAIPSICGCENVSVRNVSEQAITVQNANIIFDYAGIRRVR